MAVYRYIELNPVRAALAQVGKAIVAIVAPEAPECSLKAPRRAVWSTLEHASSRHRQQ